jgi:3-deoxy-D-manno-octulosonic acid kinase
VVARSDDLPQLAGLIERHDTLYHAAAQQPRIADLQGRGVAIVTRLGGEICVVRHFHRGGAVLRLLGDKYLRTGNRALSELRASEGARARGVATPPVHAAAWYEHGMFRRFDIATSFIPDARDLAAEIFDHARAAVAVQHTAALIRAMLSAGVVHRDLNLKNILIARERAYLLDLDRTVLVDRVSRFQRSAMRARFLRSLAKWEARSGAVVSAPARLTLQKAFDG